MTLDLQSVATAMGAEWGGPHDTAGGWSVDTRTQDPRDVDFALRGPNHDGHDFVQAALEKCAAAVVVERPGLPCGIQVPDTLLALQQLATWARRSWGGQVIGVT